MGLGQNAVVWIKLSGSISEQPVLKEVMSPVPSLILDHSVAGVGEGPVWGSSSCLP